MRIQLRASLLVGVLLLTAGCAARQAGGGGEPGTGRLSINLVLIANLPAGSPAETHALIDVRNDMDRSVRVDFEGPSISEVSVGPHSTSTIRLDPGSYRVRGSGPALPSIEPPGIPIAVERGKHYRLEVTYLFR